jgi:hypothetical protein
MQTGRMHGGGGSRRCDRDHRGEKGRGEIGGVVSALSAGAYATTLLVMVDRVKGGGRAPLTPYQAGLNLPS